jgi:hypothetical protein
MMLQIILEILQISTKRTKSMHVRHLLQAQAGVVDVVKEEVEVKIIMDQVGINEEDTAVP